MSEQDVQPGVTLPGESPIEALIRIGASGDWIGPVGQMAQEILANGYSLMIDLDTCPVERPADVTWYLGKKGVACHWPMVISNCLLFVVDKSKASYACMLLNKVGIVVENPPPSTSRKQVGLSPQPSMI